MKQSTSSGCDDPGGSIRELAGLASSSVLLLFSCRCCSRIDPIIITDAGRNVLKIAEQFCSEPSDSQALLTNMVKLAEVYEEKMRAIMVRAAEVEQVSLIHDAACARFYAAVATRITAQYCVNPSIVVADEISDNVALSRAFFTASQGEDGDLLPLKEMQKRFDQVYNAERLAHCDLLRTAMARR